MISGYNVYIPQGRLSAEAKTNLDAIQVIDKFFIVVDENKNVIKHLYGSEKIEETVFWKIIKSKTESYESLFVCPNGDEYTSLVNLFNHFNFDKAFWNRIRRLTYKEAFSIPNTQLQIEVFGNLSIAEMIENLGYERIAVEGKRVKRRIYSEDGSYFEEERDNVYELLKVEVSKLLPEEQARQKVYNYCIKCWCASTKNEHYLWIEDEYATDPLTGIASTCRIQKDLLPLVKSMKRQGDLFLLEFKEGFNPSLIDPKKEKIALTSDQYFDLLVAET